MIAGQKMRALRESLGLTIRDVETATEVLARKYANDDYYIPMSRLSDIETKGVIPNIYRLYGLAVIYRIDVLEILEIYGIDLAQVVADQSIVARPKTHVVGAAASVRQLQMPVKLDPGFDIRRTTDLGRMIESWGPLPLTFLADFADQKHTYGYVGTEDFTMYPILLPGSFIQIDESRNKVKEGVWRSEYERPIYFVETREGFTCCWCSNKNDQLVLQPHPLSPIAPRIVKDGKDAEVIGQVIAMAMRLDILSAATMASAPARPPQLN